MCLTPCSNVSFDVLAIKKPWVYEEYGGVVFLGVDYCKYCSLVVCSIWFDMQPQTMYVFVDESHQRVVVRFLQFDAK